MAESPTFKVQIDYKNPENVEAEVPGSQQIREFDSNAEPTSDVGTIATTSDAPDDFTLSPVITVTKKEAAFTKGDLKLQKVTVTEDIAFQITEIQNGVPITLSRSHQRSAHSDDHMTRTITSNESKQDDSRDVVHEKRSRIPMLKFRQAAEKVRKERDSQNKEDNAHTRPRRSSIPRLKKETKITTMKQTITTPNTEPEDEFDKIYGEIVDDKQENADYKLLAAKIEDPEKLESKFEEIIHAYQEDSTDDQHIQVENVQLQQRQTKIPALKRRKVDGGSASNLSAIVDNIRLKNAVRKSQEFNAQEGSEEFTRTITTRRIYCERSREVTSTQEIKPDNNTVHNNNIPSGFKKGTSTVLASKTEVHDRNTSKDDNLKEIRRSKLGILRDKYTANDIISCQRGIKVQTNSENNRDQSELRSKDNIQPNDKDDIINKVTSPMDVTKKEDETRSTNSEIRFVEDFEIKNIRSLVSERKYDSSEENSGTIAIKSSNIEDIETNQIKNDSNATRSESDNADQDNNEEDTKIIHVDTETEIYDVNDKTFENPEPNKTYQIIKSNIVITTDNSNEKPVIKTEQIVKESIRVGIPTFTKVTRTQSQENVENLEINKTLKWESLHSKPLVNISKIITKIQKIDHEKPNNVENAQQTESQFPEEHNNIEIENDQGQTTNETLNKENNEVTTPAVNKQTLQKTIENSENNRLDEGQVEVTILKGNVSRLINKISFRESKSIPIKTPILEDETGYNSENVERVRRIDKMISNFGKIDSTEINTDSNIESKEIVTTTIKTDRIYVQEKQMIEHEKENESSKLNENIHTEDLTILKGNVSRIINKIGSTENSTIIEINKNDELGCNINTNSEIEKSPATQDLNEITNETADTVIVNKAESILIDSNAIQKTIDTNNDRTEEKIYINIEEEKANYKTGTRDDYDRKIGLTKNITSPLNKLTNEEEEKKEMAAVKDELPKRKTVLSKVAIFESMEAKEPYPRRRGTRSENKISKLIAKVIDINEKPRIVDEVLKKHPETDSNDASKININLVTIEPQTVNEIWKTSFNKENKVQNISVVKDFQQGRIYNLYDNKFEANQSLSSNEATDGIDIKDIKEPNPMSISDEAGHNLDPIAIRPNIYFMPNENNDQISKHKTSDEQNTVTVIRPAIHYISNDAQNISETLIVSEERPNINYPPNDVFLVKTDNLNPLEENISDVRPNIHFMSHENNNQNTTQTAMTSHGLRTNQHFIPNEAQNTENDVVTTESITANVGPNINYLTDGDSKDPKSENSSEIYERVKTKCATYERNVSTISRKISRSESREYSHTFDRDFNQNDFKTADFNGGITKKCWKSVPDFEDIGFRRKEELSRAKSVVETDLGDAVKGTVNRLVGRLKSIDFDKTTEVSKSEKINIKERPRKSSVLEKIALFEGKLTASKLETTVDFRVRVMKRTASLEISEEEYLQKIAELSSARLQYQKFEDVPKITLSNGMEMPVLAVGTSLLNSRLIPHIISAAIDLGYRAFDCAYIYGNEKEVGRAIRAKIDDGTVRREELFITSKLWSTFHRPDLVEAACKSSLQNMGLSYFDLYLIHNPMSFKEGSDPVPKIATVLQYSQHDYLDAWFGMETVLSLGLVRSIGVSNFNSTQIQRVLDKGRVKPVVNQVECHPYLTQERLHNFCSARTITLSCFGVLGSKGTPAEYKSSLAAAIDDPLVQVMASGLNVTAAQLLIRYQIQLGHNVVVKSSSAAHLWDNLQALTFSVTDAQMQALHALNRNKRIFSFIGMGDTHKHYPFLAAF